MAAGRFYVAHEKQERWKMGLSASQCQGAAFFSRLLSRLFLDAPGVALLEEMGKLDLRAAWPFTPDAESDRAFAELAKALAGDKIESLSRGLRDEHMLLFIGLGMPLVPLWGSVYLDEENLLLGASTRELEKFLINAGLAFQLKEREPLDHLGLLLAALDIFLTRLAENPEDERAVIIMREFLAAHLGPWLPRCLAILEERARSPFYKAIGRLTAALYHEISTLIDVKPEKKRLYF